MVLSTHERMPADCRTRGSPWTKPTPTVSILPNPIALLSLALVSSPAKIENCLTISLKMLPDDDDDDAGCSIPVLHSTYLLANSCILQVCQ